MLRSTNASIFNITESYYSKLLQGKPTSITEDETLGVGIQQTPIVQIDPRSLPTDDDQDNEDNEQLLNIIKSFFMNTEDITDGDIDALANSIGIDHEDLENIMFKMLQDYIRNDASMDDSIPAVDDDDDGDSDYQSGEEE